jgi:hypothetical protein
MQVNEVHVPPVVHAFRVDNKGKHEKQNPPELVLP